MACMRHSAASLLLVTVFAACGPCGCGGLALLGQRSKGTAGASVASLRAEGGGRDRDRAGSARASLALSEQLPVWVHGYARSGTSSVLSMVALAQVGTPQLLDDTAQEEDDMVLHVGHDCYEACGNRGGRCSWCGAGACCRNGWKNDPSECSQALRFQTGVHECVAINPPRHGVFSLFEPCHKGDNLEPELAEQGCPGLVLSLAQCRFEQIRRLHGWNDKHSRTNGVIEYSPTAAHEACTSAHLVTFKTISQANEDFRVLQHGIPVLQLEPRLRLLDIVRDPRGIYGSWMSTFPFNDTRLGGVKRDVKALTTLCDSFAAGLDANHNNLHRIVFEQLVRDPESTMREVYKFLKVPFGAQQMAWLQENFNAKECPGVDMFIAPYSDCHTNATASLDKWRTILHDYERQAFLNHEACQNVARAYDYPLY